jgi:hypothetical protein
MKNLFKKIALWFGASTIGISILLFLEGWLIVRDAQQK